MCLRRIGEFLKEIMVNFILKLDVIFKFLKVRYVLYVLKFKVEVEFEILVKKCVIEKCDFGEWEVLVVFVCKKDELVFVCVDFKVIF